MTHKPVRFRRLAWLVCARCGLVFLRNAATGAAIRAACPGLDDRDVP